MLIIEMMWDKENYLQEAYKQLNNQNNYLKLASDPTPTFLKAYQ